MTEKDDEASAFFTAVQAAIDFGGPGYGNDPVLGFNTASQHVLVLLEDAVAAFEHGSYLLYDSTNIVDFIPNCVIDRAKYLVS